MQYERVKTVLCLLFFGATVGIVLGGIATPAVADEHTKETADDYTDEANYTVTFPNPTDHYPGDRNEENGSIQYFAAGEDAFVELGAEEGAYLDFVIVRADWIDYSACDVDNTAVFGIDRGSNNSGTQVDEDLVSRQKDTDFREDGLVIEFYDWRDLGGDPPYMAPEDAIVAVQGDGSSGGPCLTVTNEPGWYQVQGFLNGTEADNGPNEEPSDDANLAGVNVLSNYIYVCECDSEAEAREKLGPPPDERSGAETPTPAPTSTSTTTATETPDSETTTPTSVRTATVTETSTPTATEAPESASETPTSTATASDGEDEGGNSAANSDPLRGTPTPAEAPGFGGIVALIGLLAGGLLARRS